MLTHIIYTILINTTYFYYSHKSSNKRCKNSFPSKEITLSNVYLFLSRRNAPYQRWYVISKSNLTIHGFHTRRTT